MSVSVPAATPIKGSVKINFKRQLWIFRNMNRMTQKGLGKALGLLEKADSVRVAQSESGNQWRYAFTMTAGGESP